MKNQLRKQVRQVMSNLDPMSRYARSLAVCKHLTQQGEFLNSDVVMIYLPMPDEVDTTAIALASWQMSKTVAAPQVAWEHRRLHPVEVTSLDTGMKIGRHGICEPADGQPIPLNMIDFIVVPGVAFDRKGQRLGRGGGFYDKLLASTECRAFTCGVALREQIVDELHVEGHDMAVDMVITDEEVLRFPR